MPTALPPVNQVSPEGQPHCSLMFYVTGDNGRHLYMLTRGGTQKYRNVSANPFRGTLNYITPDYVHVLAAGRIVTSGGKDLALRLEDEGYGPILRENGLAIDVPDEALALPREPETAPAGR